MGDHKRFDVFFEKHLGLGIRWMMDDGTFWCYLSVSIMFVTINIGIWRLK
jgi:hypothetical protein